MDALNVAEMGLGTNIKVLRIELDESQEAFGARFNVSGSAVSQWESEDTEPTDDKLAQMAVLAGISADQMRDRKPLDPLVIPRIPDASRWRDLCLRITTAALEALDVGFSRTEAQEVAASFLFHALQKRGQGSPPTEDQLQWLFRGVLAERLRKR